MADLVRQLVSAWRPEPREYEQVIDSSKVAELQGTWILDDGTHAYIRLIGQDLLGPYCFGGNSELTGYFSQWKRVGGYWFAQFQWMNGGPRGFAFVTEKGGVLEGRWWYDHESPLTPHAPLAQGGVRFQAVQRRDLPTPAWVETFFSRARRGGIA